MTHLASLLEAQSAALMTKWLERVRQEVALGGETTIELRNHLPIFLQELVKSLRAGHSTASAQPARDHGSQRYRIGFDSEMLVREYAILRDVIFDAAQHSDASIDWVDIRRLAGFISEAVAEGVAEYNRCRVVEQTKVADAAMREVKEREERLTTLAATLRLNEEKLRRVVEAAGAGTWDLEVQTGIIHADARMNELMGLPPGEFFSLKSGVASLPFEGDRTMVDASLAAALKGEQGGHFHAEFRTGGKNGMPLRWVESRAKVLLDTQGKPMHLGGTMVDITPRKIAADLAKRQADFERQLIGIVSHDLNNPLTAILLAVDILERRHDLPEAVVRKIVRIKSAGQRARRMIGDLLDFTKARLGGGLPVKPQPLDLHELIDSTVSELRASAPDRFVVEHAGPGHGEWDADRIAQATQNLLSNALKYSPPATPIRVKSVGLTDMVEVHVHNEGKPIEADKLTAIFEPMQRASADVKQVTRSVGLGLYIVKSIVEGHAGEVVVQSTQRTGTTFSIRLPRHARGN